MHGQRNDVDVGRVRLNCEALRLRRTHHCGLRCLWIMWSRHYGTQRPDDFSTWKGRKNQGKARPLAYRKTLLLG